MSFEFDSAMTPVGPRVDVQPNSGVASAAPMVLPATPEPIQRAAATPIKRNVQAERPVRFAALKVGPRRALKACALGAFTVVIGYQPVVNTLTATSTEAFINAPLTTLRAPVTATVSHVSEDLQTGQSLPQGTLAMSLVPYIDDMANPLANVSFEHTASVSSLAIDAFDREDEATTKRIAVLKAHQKVLDAQTNQFIAGRKQQLEASLRAADAAVSNLRAQASVAEQHAMDADRAVRAGEARRMLVDIAINNLAAAEDAVREARARRDMIAVELKAIKAGTFIGDSYNNVPWSAQRSTEIDLEIARLQIDAESRVRPVANSAPIDPMTTASIDFGPIETDITLPQELRVWEVLASHGEIVTAGQPLARMVQCNQVVVTASVDEGLYTRLAIGDPATFRMRGDDRVLDGTVIRLSGMADAAANLAISPVNLEQAPYRVTVSVPAMREDGECAIGKSGRVTFNTAPMFGGR